MADGDGEITVVIDPALGVDTAGAAGGNAEVKAVVADGKDGKTDPIVALKQQHDALVEKDKQREEELARQRAATEEATRKAQEAEKELEVARVKSVDSDLERVITGIQAAQAEIEAAQAEYVTVFESGDIPKIAKAQSRISRAEAQMVRLEEAKQTVEEQIESRKNAPPQRRVNPDPVEAFIERQTPQSAAWLRSRDRSWITDPRKSALLSAAHYNALAQGHRGDTPEYFNHLEEYIGEKKPVQQQNNNQRQRTPPVAPVQNTGGTGTTQGGGIEVRLSPSEAAAATDGTHVWNYDDPSPQKRFKKGDPIGVNEFARRKAIMKEQGVYDKVYLEQ